MVCGSTTRTSRSWPRTPRPYKVEGIGYDFIPDVLDQQTVDKWYKTDDKESFKLARRLIAEEGLLVGGSSGSAMAAMVKAVKDLGLGKDDVVVVILPDSIRSYLTKFADDDWLAANDLLLPTDAAAKAAATAENGESNASSATKAGDPYAGATIRSLRLKPVTSVLKATSCAEAIETMRDRGFDQLPVLSGPGGKLVGLVTLGNLLSYISRGRATGQSPVGDVMFNFGKMDEVVTDPREGKGAKRRKFVEITLDTPLTELSNFFEWNSAAVVTELGDGKGKTLSKPVAVVTKVDLLTWMLGQLASWKPWAWGIQALAFRTHDTTANDVDLDIKLPHLGKRELFRSVLAEPAVLLFRPDIVGAHARVQQALAPRQAYAAELGFQIAAHEGRGQRGEEVELVRGDEDGDGAGRARRAAGARAALQRELDRYSYVAGEFVWTGFDYIGEPTPYDTSRSSYFGIVDMAGFKKDRFYLYQSRWRADLPMAHILPHWTWPDRVGQVTPVHVFTSGDEAELFVNGKSAGRKKKAAYTYRIRWDDVKYAAGDLKVVAYKDGKEWATDTKRTVGSAAKLNITADRTTLAGDGYDLSFITVAVVDANGDIVPQASNNVTFSVTGPGKIVSTDNGNPSDFTVFPSPSRKAFSGLVLSIVRADAGASGDIVVSATSPGLPNSSITLRAG
ncbi:hypothetical protein ONZ43_g6058 [Nemania bipapillata]|uniref:Uncharacterized protein n=1 Tax=Nemania bipapillata TaxID=110536 RepID=A0ACC2I314_9PEZI|nr:hypothetical protein ONZ43_g6058 [Nemania bipapillata]